MKRGVNEPRLAEAREEEVLSVEVNESTNEEEVASIIVDEARGAETLQFKLNGSKAHDSLKELN